ncbi:MAG: hypothetical protein KIC92_07445 [Clostridiales bacterium]|nr:hypothetical protein [Clostridiales bacterium]
MEKQEKLIKTRNRVRQHGEVFTPVKTVNEILNMEGLKEKIEDIRATILEPAVGEGIFLVEILKRRFANLLKKSSNIVEFENNALISLSTIYGIELLEDNVKKCGINIYECFYYYYNKAIYRFDSKPKKKVLSSAKTIISSNIVQGNFLTRKTANNKPIILSEWKEVNNTTNEKNIKVIRTEYTLEEIFDEKENELGNVFSNFREVKKEVKQLSLFEEILDLDEEKEKNDIFYKYVECSICNVYKEEMEKYER